MRGAPKRSGHYVCFEARQTGPVMGRLDNGTQEELELSMELLVPQEAVEVVTEWANCALARPAACPATGDGSRMSEVNKDETDAPPNRCGLRTEQSK